MNKKIILVLSLMIVMNNNKPFVKYLSKKNFIINNSKNYYIINYFYKNETYKLINSNLNRSEYVTKGLQFLNEIKKNHLNNISNQINFLNKHPKISLIIPIYNCEQTIELSLNSILLQTLKEIEIILVNDLSSDNSSQIIKKYQSIDRRIIILNNKRNMGTLYSRCIGALNSRGEYIFGLDNDDLLLDKEVLETVYLNSKINNFDIVEIKPFNIPNYNPKNQTIWDGEFINHPNNLILHQPELGTFSIAQNKILDLSDHFIWGKCIKTRIYKLAVNKLGKKRYSYFNCWTEDISMVFIIFNIAKSFIFLNMFGIFHITNPTTASKKLNNYHKFITHIFFLDILYDFSKNDFVTKKYVAEYALTFSKDLINELDIKSKLYFNSIIKKIIECKYISNEYKQKIIYKFK